MRCLEYRRHLVGGAILFLLSASPARSQETSSTKFPEEVLNTQPERLAFEIGHNATPTSYAMKAGTWTVGHYGVGYAPTDSVFIATSPWILTSYNTLNLNVKFIRPVSSTARIGFFASYFDSYESRPFLRCESQWDCDSRGRPVPVQRGTSTDSLITLPNSEYSVRVDRYQFQAATLQALAGFDLGRTTIHTGIKYSYFFNDDHPYSLRMDPGDDAIRGQLDATVLIEHRLADRVRLNFELGSLGLTDIEPYLHVGTSIAIVFPKWLVQIGGSMTGRFGRIGTDDFWTPGTYEERLHTSREGFNYFSRYLTSAVHPEVQAQYFF